jgi:hypothetical protein
MNFMTKRISTRWLVLLGVLIVLPVAVKVWWRVGDGTRVRALLDLQPGTAGTIVLAKFGMPTWWGTVDRSTPTPSYRLDRTIVLDGDNRPLAYAQMPGGKMTWVYRRPREIVKHVHTSDSCVVLMFTSNKLDRVVSGSVWCLDPDTGLERPQPPNSLDSEKAAPVGTSSRSE